MPRFFVEKENISENDITIVGEDVKHIKNVLRMKAGDEVTLCDGLGNDFSCVLNVFEKDFIEAKIIDKKKSEAESNLRITLYQGVAKGDKMDFIIQKNVEMGISRIVPVLTERTVVRFNDNKDREAKRQRWQRIATEASKQSGRGAITQVDMPMTFEQALKDSQGSEYVIVPYEKERDSSLKSTLLGKKFESVAVFIGPEGGFSEDEIEKAISSKATPVTLGKRILRTETCGLVMVSILMYEMGDIGK